MRLYIYKLNLNYLFVINNQEVLQTRVDSVRHRSAFSPSLNLVQSDTGNSPPRRMTEENKQYSTYWCLLQSQDTKGI